MIKRLFIPSSLLLLFLTLSALSGDPAGKSTHIKGKSDSEKITEESPKKFDAGKMILHHIVDAHEWHVLDIGDFHLSIPLPVILWHDGKMHVFLSSKFNHGHSLYKGFGISTENAASTIVKADIEKFHREHIIVQDPSQKRPLDFSITKTVLAIFISGAILIVVFLFTARLYRQRGTQAPRGLQSVVEPLILFVRDNIARSSIGEKKYVFYMPYLLTLFFFIFLNNLMGLIPIFPGGANVTGNISVTLVLAAFTFFTIIFTADKHYWIHIFNTPGVPMMLKIPIPLMPVIELVGVFIKPIVLMIRLFANITAGHIIALSFISLIFIFGQMGSLLGFVISPVSVIFSVFVKFIEMLVAFIQAYVFTLLSALYIGMAVAEEH